MALPSNQDPSKRPHGLTHGQGWDGMGWDGASHIALDIQGEHLGVGGWVLVPVSRGKSRAFPQ